MEYDYDELENMQLTVRKMQPIGLRLSLTFKHSNHIEPDTSIQFKLLQSSYVI